MKIKVVLDSEAIIPTKAHSTDAGYDLYSREKFILGPCSSCTVDTGVHMEIPEGYAGIILPKSGLNVKYDIHSFGVIDCGYTGSIRVKMDNLSNRKYEFEKGDKLTQILIVPIADTELVLADKLDDTERGDGGFGSSGR